MLTFSYDLYSSELACLLSLMVFGNGSSHWIRLNIHREYSQLLQVEQ